MSGAPAILLVGHGSARHPDSAAPILALAEALKRAGPWSGVAAAFMKQSPGLEGALDRLDAAELVVVPVFAGKGYYTETLIPRALGLDGPVTRRDGRVLRLTAPAGCHPRIPGLLACRADGVARSGGLTAAETSLLLIAHGSGRPGGAGETPKAIAAAIAAMNHFAEVALVFLEQEPLAENWPDLLRGRQVVALPLLVAQGMHASQDIPPLFGLRAGQSGPVDSHGRTVRLAAGLGAEPELVGIIADMANQAMRQG
jgi:sirohydrochlorin cobaltochelatase